MTFDKILTPEVTDILNNLEINGFEAFLVGGCVRDAILKRDCCDIDIATNASAQQMTEIFKTYEIMTAGFEFGTVNVKGKLGNIFDITSFRLEGEYLDGRHPSSVTFGGDIHTDLARRDFTVNSLAVNLHGELVDDFGGLNDCAARLIKCVREPKLRFCEDYLRILRALRFSAVLDFSIERQTADAIHKLPSLAADIPPERACEELRKMLSAAHNQRLKKLLIDFSDVFENLFTGCFLKEAAERIGILQCETNFILKAAIIFSKANLFDCRLLNHKNFFSKSEEKLFYSLLDADSHKLQSRKDAVKYTVQLGKGNTKIFAALKMSAPEEQNFINDIQNDINTGQFPFSVGELAVKGTDLIDIGLHGKAIGDALKFLLDCVQNKELPNERNTLINYVKNIFLQS